VKMDKGASRTQIIHAGVGDRLVAVLLALRDAEIHVRLSIDAPDGDVVIVLGWDVWKPDAEGWFAPGDLAHAPAWLVAKAREVYGADLEVDAGEKIDPADLERFTVRRHLRPPEVT
jgi:hypothetical protein